jgi:AraC-like DNA-binding protein
MKAQFEDIKRKQGHRSFMAYSFETEILRFNLHYHPEYELTYITHGKGARMVGDTLSHFSDGDLVLLDSNLPHTWTGEGSLFRAIVIQFSPSFIDSFVQWQEFKGIRAVLDQAKQGLVFQKTPLLIQKIEALVHEEDLQQALSLLAILQMLSKTPSELLSQADSFVLNRKTESRINTVCQFVQEKYTQRIDLQEVANLIHVSESAFCKFFKKTTGKTFSEYLNFVRIHAVCKALRETDKTILEIAFANGFESLTYFNRVFKKEKGMTPKEFRQAG